MHVLAVPMEHPEVRRIQPTFHCLERFRQRRHRLPGADTAAEALRETIADADVARVPPPWAAGQDAAWWAVNGALAFPLSAGTASGEWLALTCLVRG